MSMTKERAQEILRGYMTPTSPAINQFAQKGLVTESLTFEVKAEIRLKNEELARLKRDDWELFEITPVILDIEQLEHVDTMLTYVLNALGPSYNETEGV